jgi:hypothetical protein
LSETSDTPSDEAGQRLRVAVKLKKGVHELPPVDGVRAPLLLLPLLSSVDPGKLCKLLERAREGNPDLPDPSLWYQVATPPELCPDDLANALGRLDQVQTAYVMRPVCPPVNPVDDPLSLKQGYLDEAPVGIDARYAWGLRGGDGAGIGFVDLERGWKLDHPDLAAAGITLISGLNKDFRAHGTSALGEVLMVDNSIGGIGIAPAATGRVVSQWQDPNSDSPNTAAAIHSAAAEMSPGDVLLLEAQDLDPAGAKSYWPVEVADAVYEAIVTATAAGIVVVEAAGNGEHDLDQYTNKEGKRVFDRTSPDFRDSGAIMVAAGYSDDHTCPDYSNRGNRIDCYAWGDSVETTDIGPPPYRSDFGGTSAASPIVAGAALIVQGLAKVCGRRYSSQQMRDILKTNGTKSPDPIGVMPNLRNIIADNNLIPPPDPTDPT